MGPGRRHSAGPGQMGRAGQALRRSAAGRKGLVGRHRAPHRCRCRSALRHPHILQATGVGVAAGARGGRAPGRNWASSTGSFSFDYMRAIMLPDALKSHDHPVMILENKAYVPGQMCEVMMGEHSRLIKLVEFLEEGEDYVRAAFEWQHAGKN